VPVNRNDFQELAELHLQHAKALLDVQLYSGAYYMCGYTVECALKACICKRTEEFDFYVHPEIARQVWSHKFRNLIEVAGLEEEVLAARQRDIALDVKWGEAENWSEGSRYERRGQKEAEALFSAVSDPTHGVLACIRRFW
jgi:HEPN domain-containing protein